MFLDNIIKNDGVDQVENFCNLSFGTFQVDILNLLEIKHIIYQKLRIQPSEIEKFPYYELEYLLEHLKKWLEREKEENDKQNDESNTKYNQKTMMQESSSMMKKHGINPSSMKPPSMGNMKMPKL